MFASCLFEIEDIALVGADDAPAHAKLSAMPTKPLLCRIHRPLRLCSSFFTLPKEREIAKW
jgi:hypothetical protein